MVLWGADWMWTEAFIEAVQYEDLLSSFGYKEQ
jgi:hypothetical protein